MLAIYLTIDTITVILLLSLSMLALQNYGYKKQLNRLFVLFAVMLAIWLPANHLGNSLDVPYEFAVFMNHLVFGTSFIATLTILKIVVLISEFKKDLKLLSALEIIMWPFALLSFTPLVGSGIEYQQNEAAVVFGPLGRVYGILLITLVSFMVYVVAKGILSLRGQVQRQLSSIGVALIISAPIILLLSYILPVVTGIFAFTEFGVTPAIIIAVAFYYSVIRYQLFDVRAVITRASAYILTLAVLTGMYMLAVYVVSSVFFMGQEDASVGLNPINVIFALAVAFIFQPIKTFFDKTTDKLFFRSDYDRDVFFRQFGKIISYDTDLVMLLKQSGAYIASTFKAERVFFHIFNRGVFGVGGASRMRREIPEVDMAILEDYYRKNYEMSEVMVRDTVTSESVRKILASYKAHLALPLAIQGEFIGCLFIGEHKSRGFRVRDIQAIESVANELTIAVQNSLSVEEIRDLNESLRHKISVATKELRYSNRQLKRLDETKDEFMSMASHQLRTPLTSIKGYLDMVLQGDLGKITNTQRAVLSEAFLSSERMVSLINDFLNVSRLQTGKFSIDRVASNVSKMVEEELQMMAVLAGQRNLKFKSKIDPSISEAMVDLNKLRQVVVNMVDNAIYYSKPGTVIKISLQKKGHEIEFTVKDTGIGVPESEQAGLFGKFFRASNARRKRPDGTGVGLFLAKKVIAMHGGQIVFKSEENKGSTFGFRLPIA